jgi:hypothetical protein
MRSAVYTLFNHKRNEDILEELHIQSVVNLYKITTLIENMQDECKTTEYKKTENSIHI